jgi:hypothetical protein
MGNQQRKNDAEALIYDKALKLYIERDA